jgi:hypothetical protein
MSKLFRHCNCSFFDIRSSHHEWFSFAPSPMFSSTSSTTSCLAQDSRDIKKALELSSVCNHPSAVWLTKLFVGRDVDSCEEARQVFLGCENHQELFVLPVCLEAILMRLVELLSSAMVLRKRRWRDELVGKMVLNGPKNLLLKENVTVSTALDIAAGMDLDAKKTGKEQNRTF